MLKLTDISKEFGKGEFMLQRISLTLGKGLHFLVGPNGSGKSTLLRIITNVIYPDGGSISFQGQDIHSNVHGFKCRLGYLPQTIGFYDHMTGREFLRYMASLKGLSGRLAQERTDEVETLLGIRPYAKKKIATWSVGRRQRLGLAQALLNDPAILVLDEPFCGLDLEETDEVGQLLTQLAQHKVILISSHVMQELAITKLLLLIHGKLQFTGLSTVFLEEARGRVWSVNLAKEEWLAIQPTYPTSAVVLEGDRCQCKIVSEEKPAIVDAKVISPTLEDAYLFWLARYHAKGRDRSC